MHALAHPQKWGPTLPRPTRLLAATMSLSTVAPRMIRRGSPCPLYAKAALREGKLKGPAHQASQLGPHVFEECHPGLQMGPTRR